MKERESSEKKNDEIFLLKNKLQETESRLQNYINLDKNKVPVKEIYIADAVKVNIELMNEVKTSRDLIQTISKKFNQLKSQNDNLNNKLEVYLSSININ